MQIVSNKLKNNETIICKIVPLLMLNGKSTLQPAAIVYLVDNPWILLAVQGLSPMVSDLVLSKPYTVYIVYDDVEGTGEIRSL
jgi:hypothetical protein